MQREGRVCDMHRAGTWTGSESFILAVRIEKFSVGATSEFNIPISSVAYKFLDLMDRMHSSSTRHPECLSLNKRRLPHLASPSESLCQRVDLIVMAAGKRQQLGNKRFEPWSVLRQQNRTALEQVDL